MPQNTLIAPIQVNAIYVEAGQTVVEPKANFRRLPWSDGEQDHNSSTPFLGQSILSPAFEDRNYNLQKGIHLHWVLPESHRTYSTASADTTSRAPAAPNRWLITRTVNNTTQQWIVESDYVSTTITAYNQGAVAVPNANLGVQGVQPFLFVGRQFPLESQEKVTDPSDQYWADLFNVPLTAFGHGDLAFNSFYPGCSSVFGFYDAAPGDMAQPLQYEVLGWYNESSNDLVQVKLAEINSIIATPSQYPGQLKNIFPPEGEYPSWMAGLIGNLMPGVSGATPKTVTQLRAQLLSGTLNGALSGSLSALAITAQFTAYCLQQLLNWAPATAKSWAAVPEQSIYYSTIQVSAASDAPPSFDQVAVGQTGPEAISAFLANQLSDSDAITGSEIELQLNTLLHKGAVKNDLTDVDQNLNEARHRHSFQAKDSGLIWRIRSSKQKGANSQEIPELPAEIALLLNNLNTAQSNYDQGLATLESMQVQLYLNWCKYQEVCYPPLGAELNYPDQNAIRDYLKYQRKLLKNKIAEVGTYDAVPDGQATGVLGMELQTTNQALHQALVAFNAKSAISYTLSSVPAPRYYQPKDPVVLFASKSQEQTSSLLNVKGSLPVYLATQALPMTTPALAQTTLTGMALPEVFSSITQNSWSPQLLQWLTLFFQDQTGSLGPSGYSVDFIADNFSLSNSSFDLQPANSNSGHEGLSYSGSTYLAAGTQAHLIEELEAYLIAEAGGQLTAADFTGAILTPTFPSIFGAQAEQDYSNPQWTAYQAYNTLAQVEILTQSLGGFNQALLQQQNNVQLPIADPIGFPREQKFAQKTATALNGASYPFPVCQSQFVPLRAGQLYLSQLALIDHFGRPNKVEVANPIIAQSLQQSGAENNICLNPRFAQKTRLNFRWLVAESGPETEVEMNSHPASSPVCGWLVPNYADGSVEVYRGNGQGLGRFTTDGWMPFPGATDPVTTLAATTPNINPSLLAVLLDFQAQNDLSQLMNKLEKAQQCIAPEYYAESSLAVLLGKPVAVVRARLSLEVEGGLCNDQSWISFQHQLEGAAPQTYNYEQVNVPVQLGDAGQFNDGLIAFWQEQNQRITGAATWTTANAPIPLALAAQPQTVTLLMDPHGIVHATTGMLPVKTIRIPTEQYASALKQMVFVFRTQPILTPTENLQVSLPKEQGFQWSWLQQDSAAWMSTPDLLLISNALFEAGWNVYLKQAGNTTPTANNLWAALQSSGWIVALPQHSSFFQLLPLTNAVQTAMEKSHSDSQVTQIQKVLNQQATGIKPFNYQPDFYKQQQLVEGYLMLSPNA